MSGFPDQKKLVIEQQIGELLEQKGWVMGTAESCTGGRIASLITYWPGCSKHYTGSIISYSNGVKQNVLGVSSEDLEEFGAVSQPVVEQMVKGAMKVLGCDCAVATSGIAGPDGGTPGKPVGTVWIAAGINEKVISKKYLFGKDRKENIEKAATKALEMLLEELKKV